MAAVFERVGFEPHDVHMSDLCRAAREARRLPRPGGLRRILVWRRARRRRGLGQVHPVPPARCAIEFQRSSSARDTFSLGVCNGCQMFAALKEIDSRRASTGRASCATAASSSKAALSWSKSCSRRRCSSPAWTARAADRRGAWRRPRGVRTTRRARGTGRERAWCRCASSTIDGSAAERYPANPNGSPLGMAGITTPTAA